MPEQPLINKKKPPTRGEKSYEELTFELLEYKEELDRSIRDYEDAVKRMKHKDRAWTIVTFAIMILVGFILVTSIGGIKILLEQPEHVRPILWACLGCLLLGFVVAHWLARWERRADFNEDVMRRRREQAAVYYADLLQQLEELKAKKKT
jgi:fatty acid desaturase